MSVLPVQIDLVPLVAEVELAWREVLGKPIKEDSQDPAAGGSRKVF